MPHGCCLEQALALAVAIPVSHLANLAMPMPGVRGFAPSEIAGLGIATLVLAIPFVLSGIVVTLALTRTAAPIGLLYGADLVGAAAGCLAIVWLLDRSDVTSTAFVTGACCAAAAWCFARYAGRAGVAAAVMAVMLAAGAVANATSDRPLGVLYPKDQWLWLRDDIVEYSKWNAHSYVTVWKPMPKPPQYWGAGSNAPEITVSIAHANIDGQAGTAITQWDGDPESIDWVQYDVSALPYHLRRGRAGVIGVGGGRDVLTAIRFGSPSITGIEINDAILGAIRGPYRDFARIANHPGVRLVHDEARSYLTRAGEQFDVLQMSLIDTWAATGAGAFTLSENGLYTREGWRVFLRSITPAGVFSVSRWFDPGNVSETTRLLSLGVAALIDHGIANPRGHLLLVTRDKVATLLVSPSAFTDLDRTVLERIAAESSFDVRVTPWREPSDDRFRRIADATSIDALAAATADPVFDFSPPTDRRPFFFNLLKPGAALRFSDVDLGSPGVMRGNLIATRTLVALAIIASVLVAAIIGWPLVRGGRPDVPAPIFRASFVYFALIGFGFMFVQIPFLQRFSVYLGHPTYAFSIVLFLMILSAGLGSLWSDRLDLGRRIDPADSGDRRTRRTPRSRAAAGCYQHDRRLAARRPNRGGRGVHRSARVPDGDLFPDRDAPARPLLRPRDGVDVGYQRRVWRDGIDRRGHDVDVGRHRCRPRHRRADVLRRGKDLGFLFTVFVKRSPEVAIALLSLRLLVDQQVVDLRARGVGPLLRDGHRLAVGRHAAVRSPG